MPIHRLNEPPDAAGRLSWTSPATPTAKWTSSSICKDIKEALEVHELIPGEPYYLGFLLMGAYQDTMGDLHNLFGRVHEAEVILDTEGRTEIVNIRHGDRAVDTLAGFGYARSELVESITRGFARGSSGARSAREEAAGLLEDYRDRLEHYTYLD